MPRWAGATGFITDAFGVDFCGGERRGGDEEPILRRSSIRIFTSPYLQKRSGEVPGAFAGLRSKENGHCHKTTVLVSGVVLVRPTGGYRYFTTIFSRCSQFAHSKVRRSWSGSSGSMSANHINSPHCGQLGR